MSDRLAGPPVRGHRERGLRIAPPGHPAGEEVEGEVRDAFRELEAIEAGSGEEGAAPDEAEADD